jgi:hypothetical protein
MPVRLLPRHHVEKELTNRRCTKIKDYSHGSGGLWMTLRGFYFTVPTEADGRTDENTLRSILLEIDGQ